MVDAPSWGPNQSPGGLQIQPLGDFDLIANTPQKSDTVFASLKGEIGPMRSVFIDNSRGRGCVVLKVLRTGQLAICPPLTADWFPLYLDANGQIEFYSTVTATIGLMMASELFSRTGATILGPPPLSVSGQIVASGQIIAAVPQRRLYVRRVKILGMIGAVNPSSLTYEITDGTGFVLDSGYFTETALGTFSLCDIWLDWISAGTNQPLNVTLSAPTHAGNVLFATILYGFLPN